MESWEDRCNCSELWCSGIACRVPPSFPHLCLRESLQSTPPHPRPNAVCASSRVLSRRSLRFPSGKYGDQIPMVSGAANASRSFELPGTVIAGCHWSPPGREWWGNGQPEHPPLTCWRSPRSQKKCPCLPLLNSRVPGAEPWLQPHPPLPAGWVSLLQLS